MGCKPNSVLTSGSPPIRHDHLTGNTGRPASRATYPEASDGPPSSASLFGLAPGGVYPALPVARQAVSSYLAISPLPVGQGPIGGVFSVALSPGCPAFALRTTVPCGVRTFLPGVSGAIMRPPLNAVNPPDNHSCPRHQKFVFSRFHCLLVLLQAPGQFLRWPVYRQQHYKCAVHGPPTSRQNL